MPFNIKAIRDINKVRILVDSASVPESQSLQKSMSNSERRSGKGKE